MIAETIERLSRISVHNREILALDQQPNASGQSLLTHTWRSSWQEIGGKRHYFRSQWEVRYACWLEYRKSKLREIAEWGYEPLIFWFKGIKRGVCSYKPDFRITMLDGTQVFHEVKGWMRPTDKTKLKRMAIYHPGVCVNLITESWFKQNRDLGEIIPGWN